MKGKYGLENVTSVESAFSQEFENNCRFVQFGTEAGQMQLKQTNSNSLSTEVSFVIRSISQTMTDMTQSTELQAFIRQKDGYKVPVKISLCICVVLS